MTAVLAAVLLLPALANAQSIDELLVRIESPDADIRREAARDLGRNGSDAAVEALNGAAADEDVQVRDEVLAALVAVRRPVAAPGVLLFLGSDVKADRERAVASLVDMHGIEEPPGRGARAMNWLLRRDDDFVLDPLRPVSPSVVGGLMGRLQDPERDVRLAAAEGLGLLRAAAAVPALTAAAGDAEERVARAAIAALGEVGHVAPETAGPALVGLLDGSPHPVDVVESLGMMAFESAGRTLLAAYDGDADGELGEAALWALSRIGYSGALATFIAELTGSDAGRRESAAAGLGRIGDRDMADGMVRDFLREDDRRVQLAYCFALTLLGETPFVDRVVLDLTDRTLGDQARDYALELGEPAVPQFVRYLGDPDKDMRLRLIELLERIGSAAAIPGLEGREQDPEADVVDRARLAIRRLRQLEEAGVEARRGPGGG